MRIFSAFCLRTHLDEERPKEEVSYSIEAVVYGALEA
jgi:hypothetical protein